MPPKVVWESNDMRIIARFIALLRRLTSDENGASMIEYTVLLGLLTVAVIGTITLVGTWMSGQWSALNAALPR